MSGYDLKSEEDVKLFLENLHTEYQFGCYGEKKNDLCHLLGDYYEAVKKDYKNAAEIYQKTCDNMDYGRSCTKIGGWKLIGKGCTKDVPTGYNYLKKACSLNDDVGCTNAGIVGVTGRSLHDEDRKGVITEGIEMLQKGCDALRSERACSFLSGLYRRGIEGVVAPSPVLTYKYALQACELGNYNACYHVSRLHKEGEGAQQSDELAEQFRKRGRELERELTVPQQSLNMGQGINVG